MNLLTDQRNDVQNAARVLLSSALSVANGLVGLTAIAYLIGYRVLSAYYHTAGAGWALDLSSSSQILSEAAAPIAFVAISAFVCYFMAADETVKTPRFIVAGMWIVGTGLTGQSVGLAGEQFQFLSTRASYSFAVIGGSLMASGAGFYIGELLADLSANRGRWHPWMLLSVCTILNLTAWYSPGVLGAARAGIEMDLKYSRLASVVLKSHEEEKWRLVSALDNKALIAAPDNEGMLRRFRLVDYAELAEIRPWSKPEPTLPPNVAKPNAVPNDR